MLSYAKEEGKKTKKAKEKISYEKEKKIKRVFT